MACISASPLWRTQAAMAPASRTGSEVADTFRMVLAGLVGLVLIVLWGCGVDAPAPGRRPTRRLSGPGIRQVLAGPSSRLQERELRPGAAEVPGRLSPVALLQLDPHEPPVVLERHEARRADAGERVADHVAGVAPEAHAAFDGPELERRDVLLVALLARCGGLKRLRLPDAVPD